MRMWPFKSKEKNSPQMVTYEEHKENRESLAQAVQTELEKLIEGARKNA